MSVSITVAKIKTYLDRDFANTKYDTTIQNFINGVVLSAIDELDNTSFTSQSNLPAKLEKPLCIQIAYEFRRRKDPGLSSVTTGDGTVSKFSVDEWLPQVKKNLERSMSYSL